MVWPSWSRRSSSRDTQKRTTHQHTLTVVTSLTPFIGIWSDDCQPVTRGEIIIMIMTLFCCCRKRRSDPKMLGFKYQSNRFSSEQHSTCYRPLLHNIASRQHQITKQNMDSSKVNMQFQEIPLKPNFPNMVNFPNNQFRLPTT